MPELPSELARHAHALLLWAKCQFPTWLRSVLDPEDLVQQTLFEALKASEKLATMTEQGALAYLRRMLANNLFDAIRKYAPSRADVSPDDLIESSRRLGEWVEAGHTSPSERAARNEQFMRLAVALSELPDAQRLAVEMRYLRQLKLDEIARALNRTTGAVEQLLHRGVAALGRVLTDSKA